MKKAKKPAARAKSEDYLPIPVEPTPDMSAVEAAMGYAFPPAQRYPVTNDYEKTGSYAPYRNEAMQMEEQKKIQDRLLNEQVKHMTRDPSSDRAVPGSPVDQLAQEYAAQPAYQSEPAYSEQPAYPKKPMYGNAPFNKIKQLPEVGTVPSQSPYQIDPELNKPFGVSPMERKAMEDAIKKAMQDAAQSGAAGGNAVKFRR